MVSKPSSDRISRVTHVVKLGSSSTCPPRKKVNASRCAVLSTFFFSQLRLGRATRLLLRAQRRQGVDVAGPRALRQEVQAQKHPPDARELQRHLAARGGAAEAAPVDLAPALIVAQEQVAALTARATRRDSKVGSSRKATEQKLAGIAVHAPLHFMPYWKFKFL